MMKTLFAGASALLLTMGLQTANAAPQQDQFSPHQQDMSSLLPNLLVVKATDDGSEAEAMLFYMDVPLTPTGEVDAFELVHQIYLNEGSAEVINLLDAQKASKQDIPAEVMQIFRDAEAQDAMASMTTHMQSRFRFYHPRSSNYGRGGFYGHGRSPHYGYHNRYAPQYGYWHGGRSYPYRSSGIGLRLGNVGYFYYNF